MEAEKVKQYLIDHLDIVMEEISERHWAAGWMMNLEYDLWAILKGDRDPDYGMGNVAEEDLEKLKELSEHLGGWCTCEGFVQMDEWLQMYAEYQKSVL